MSLEILENVNLKQYNTFHIDSVARFFCTIKSLKDLEFALDFADTHCEGKYLFLGGGSNILFVNDFNGLIIKNEIDNSVESIKIIKETEKEIFLEVGSGLEWDAFTAYSARNNYFGVENMSYIPGTVGASPVQNIGAYGVEAKDFIEKVTVYNTKSKEILDFDNKSCRFSYRDSIFKDKENKDLFILSVVYKLSKVKSFSIDYKDIQKYILLNNSVLGDVVDRADDLESLQKYCVENISLKDFRQIIINIRNSKLPDWRAVGAPGSAGSFFKNIIVNKSILDDALLRYPEIVFYKVDDNNYKLSSGYIIDKILNLKNYRHRDVGTYVNQALIIVNFDKATGAEVFGFSESIIQKCKDVLGLTLEREVNIV